jgi:20S proteasome alpha/beta subunit
MRGWVVQRTVENTFFSETVKKVYMRLSDPLSICGGFCALILSCVLFSSSATNQRRSYRSVASVPERYDRSVTTFDPSGRLLQVEYAQQAAQRKPTMLVMAVVNDTCYIVTPSSSQLDSSINPRATPIIHRISDSIYFIGVGLVGDIRAVASHLRVQAQQHLYNFDEEWSVEQAATSLSNLQHQLTHQSGVRPLGITGFLLGTNAHPYRSTMTTLNSATAVLPTAQLFRCTPGGLPEDCLYCCTGPHEALLISNLQEQYPQFTNITQAEILKDLVTVVHSTVADDRDASKDDSVLDVWVLRGHRSRTRAAVSCFQGLRNTARSFAKLHEYYNHPTAIEPPLVKDD